MTPTWTSAPHQTIARYAPVAAGRMIIVESFGRGGAPRGPPSPEATMPHHRLIAPSACRRTPLPLHRCRPAASNRMPCVVDQAEIALSTAAVAPNSPPRSSIRRRLPRPAHPQPRPPHRQIPIVRQPVTRTPRVPSWEAFGRRPSARADRSPRAGIRNPSGKPPFAPARVNWPRAAEDVTIDHHRGRETYAEKDARSSSSSAIAELRSRLEPLRHLGLEESHSLYAARVRRAARSLPKALSLSRPRGDA